MTLAFISDIHGNLEALEAVLRKIDASVAAEIVCLGDIIGYGANPSECLARVREACSTIVLGNHDEAALIREQAFGFNLHAGIAAQWTYQKVSDEEKAFLRTLPLRVVRDGILCVHSAPGDPNLWEYIVGEEDAAVMFSAFAERLCCIGHSHVAAIYPENPDLKPSDPRYRAIVNVGSVGQPRDHDPRAAWSMIDTATMEITIHRVEYDIAAAAQKILDAGLPPPLAKRLFRGM